jgi:hypothetical protein
MVFQSQDAWRNEKIFQSLWKDPFPGLRKAIVIYAVYLGCEFTYKALMAPPAKHQHH